MSAPALDANSRHGANTMPAERLSKLQLDADVLQNAEKLAAALRPVLLRPATQMRVIKLARQLDNLARCGFCAAMHSLGDSPCAADAYGGGRCGGKPQNPQPWRAERLRRRPATKPAFDAATSSGLFGEDGSGVFNTIICERQRQRRAGLQLPVSSSGWQRGVAANTSQAALEFGIHFRGACAAASLVPDMRMNLMAVLQTQPPAALQEAIENWVKAMDVAKPGFSAMFAKVRSTGATAVQCAKAWDNAASHHNKGGSVRRELKNLQ